MVLSCQIETGSTHSRRQIARAVHLFINNLKALLVRGFCVIFCRIAALKLCLSHRTSVP